MCLEKGQRPELLARLLERMGVFQTLIPPDAVGDPHEAACTGDAVAAPGGCLTYRTGRGRRR